MTDTKFTPGSWEVRIEQILPTSKAECFTVATDNFDIVSPMLGIRNEQDANLIAAAPDLYEALEIMLADYWEGSECFDKESQAYAKTVINQSRAALTKARGETK